MTVGISALVVCLVMFASVSWAQDFDLGEANIMIPQATPNNTDTPTPTPTKTPAPPGPYCTDCLRGFGVAWDKLDRTKFKTDTKSLDNFTAHIANYFIKYFNAASGTPYTSSSFSSPFRSSGVEVRFNLKGKFESKDNLPSSADLQLLASENLRTTAVDPNIQAAVQVLLSWGYTKEQINAGGAASISNQNPYKNAAAANKGWIAAVVLGILAVIAVIAYYVHKKHQQNQDAPSGAISYGNNSSQPAYQAYGANNQKRENFAY